MCIFLNQTQLSVCDILAEAGAKGWGQRAADPPSSVKAKYAARIQEVPAFGPHVLSILAKHGEAWRSMAKRQSLNRETSWKLWHNIKISWKFTKYSETAGARQKRRLCVVWNEHWEPQLKSGKLFLATLAAVSKKTSRTSTDQPPDVCIFERFRIFRECTQVLNWSAPLWSCTRFIFSKMAVLDRSRALGLGWCPWGRPWLVLGC